MRLAFAIPWRDRGRWLWEYLPSGVDGDLLFAAPEPDSRFDRKRLPPYLGEFVHLARRRYALHAYDVVFAWELRSILAVALLRRLTSPKKGQKRPAFVPVGPIFKGGILKAMPIVRWLLSDTTNIVCFSSVECVQYATLLRLPQAQFVFFPLPWLDNEEETDRNDNTILALGQSNRDYGTLIRAVRGTELPVLIVAGNDSVLGGEFPPENVCVRYNTGHHETNDLIAGATFHCIPLHPSGYSSGQTVLLRAMSRGKAVVVSDIPGVRDYVRDGETALVVPPHDAVALRNALLHLWNHAGERERLGQNAARIIREEFGFPRFTQRLVELAKTITDQTKQPSSPFSPGIGRRSLAIPAPSEGENHDVFAS